jgi:CBS domain-containing protein
VSALEHDMQDAAANKETDMRAQDLMTGPAITCHVNDTLSSAAQKMWNADIGVLPVVNDAGKVTSMITDRDICMAALTHGKPVEELLVNSAMAKHLVSAAPSATVGELERLMAEHRVRRIPIVDEAGTAIGVVSLNDLAIEAVQPDTSMRNGPSKIAHTLAAICEHRALTEEATSQPRGLP